MDRQTDRQTNNDDYITSFAEVKTKTFDNETNRDVFDNVNSEYTFCHHSSVVV